MKYLYIFNFFLIQITLTESFPGDLEIFIISIIKTKIFVYKFFLFAFIINFFFSPMLLVP